MSRICKLLSGRYGFETKIILSNNKEWNLNMNMPLFESKEIAENWIIIQNGWEKYSKAIG